MASPDPVQPALTELLERYLKQQASDQALGLAPGEAAGEVLPFEAASPRPIDPRLAWDGALAVLGYLNAAFQAKTWTVPLDWATIVASQPAQASVAFCFGNFPQLVHSLQPLLAATDLSTLRPDGTPASVSAGDPKDVGQRESFPQVLQTLGLLRLTRRFEQATRLIEARRADAPGEWQAAWANEQAALAWHRGQSQEAVQLWQSLAPTAPILFNRGMAALFTDRTADARSLLSQALALIPENDPWHYLSQLYLALAQMRR
jgi:tetratricopeptide (TPR) repeat protein